MSEEVNTDNPEDVLPADDPLAVAISLAGEEFVDDASMDVPELSKEQLESLLAGVREDFGETSGEDAPPSEDVLTLAILEGSATSEQQEEHEKLLQDDEYRNSFEERESTHSLLAEALPATFHGETEIEAPPLAEGKKEELLSGVRERFEQEEVVKEERTERKVVPFSKYFLPLAAAAAVVFAAVRLYDGGDGGSGGGEVQVASAIEFGDWPENILRGGEDGNQTTPFPTWVKFQPYSNKTDRQEWLDRETPGKAIVKVWVDGDHGVVKIHRPGKKDVEEIPLDDEKDERTQVLAILEKLRKEISGKP